MYDNCGAFPYCEVCANYIDKIRIVAECIVVPYRGNFGEIEFIGWRVKFWQFHHVLYNQKINSLPKFSSMQYT